MAGWAGRCKPLDPKWFKVQCSPQDEADVKKFGTSWHMYVIGVKLFAEVLRVDFLQEFSKVLDMAHGEPTDVANV